MASNQRPLFGRNSSGANQIVGTPKLDTFGNARPHPLDGVSPSSPQEAYDFKSAYDSPTPTLLPRHLYAPEGARTINLVKILSVPAGSKLDLFSFRAIDGSTTVFMSYGLFTDAPKLTAIQWLPTINDNRILSYHGDPDNNFIISESTGSSLSSSDLAPCQILMGTGQTLKWSVLNNSPGAVLMGVRMVGYLDMSQRLMSAKFGD